MSGKPEPNLPVPAASRRLLARGRDVRALTKAMRTMVSTRENQQFLPAHLEILDTPPSPFAMLFTWTICAMFAAALLWSVLARLDIYAVATARIELSGRSKVVQPFETSRVLRVHVRNGDQVKAGAPLIDLDPTEAKAVLTASAGEFGSLEAQMARREATIKAINEGRKFVEPRFPDAVSEPIRLRETAAMSADLAQYFAGRSALEAQVAEKVATQQRLTSTIAARQRLVSVLRERADMRQTLVNHAAGTRASVIDAMQQVEQTSADLAQDQGQFKEAQFAAQSIDRRIEQLTSETLAKQAQMLAEASQRRDSIRQDVVKANLRLDRMQLRAPIDGTVQQLAATTIGQVVTAGQALLVIVPATGPIEIEAMVLNQDIGFVTIGQEAVVKIDAFPFTRYGTVEGKVVDVSRDAVDQRESADSGDAISLTRSRSISAATGTPSTQNLVFPVTIKVEKNNIESDGKPVVLTPGMTASVEIHTGNRRVIDYVLSPIFETTSGAGHER